MPGTRWTALSLDATPSDSQALSLNNGSLALTPAAWAEKLTVAVSTPEIQINSNFSGTTVTVFGVIERDAGTVARAAPYQVAALVLGPPETVVARRKDRVLGVWLNGASETLVSAPTFYALATTPGLEAEALAAPSFKHRQIGFSNIALPLDVGRGALRRRAWQADRLAGADPSHP